MDILDNQNVEPQDYLALIPEEQRSLEALAKAKYHADTHIKTLEQKSDELRRDYMKEREENQTRAKFEDLLKRLEGQQLPIDNNPVDPERQAPTIDFNELDKRFDQRLASYEQTKKETENATLVMSKLKERFGDNYSTVVKQQINDLGLSEADFNALAKKSPNTILKSLGVDARGENFQSPMRNSSNFSPSREPVKSWSYWQNLKKGNPKLYHDPKTTNEMAQAMRDLGDKFKDGDWGKYGDA